MKPGCERAAAAAIALLVVAAAAGLGWWWSAPTRDPRLQRERLAPARPAAQITGRVELPAGAPAPLVADAMLVVYAYALDGPRLPIAVLRQPASALPLDFKLDDSLALNPAFRISQATQLVVGARLGAGDAVVAQPGDWVAPSQNVVLGTHGVRLVLQGPRP